MQFFLILLTFFSSLLLQAQTQPEVVKSEDDNHWSLILEPLGFSRQGHFAYGYVAQTSAGTADVGFVIIDSTTDEELFIFVEQDKILNANLIDSFMNRNKPLIDKALFQYKIEKQNLHTHTLANGMQLKLETSAFGFRVQLVQGGKLKEVTNQEWQEGVNGVKQLALFKSPFENRVVIVLKLSYNHSIKHYSQPLVVGCLLSL